MDLDGRVRFIPVRTEGTLTTAPEQVLIQIPILPFAAVSKAAKLGLRNRWRNDVLAWAAAHKVSYNTRRYFIVLLKNMINSRQFFGCI